MVVPFKEAISTRSVDSVLPVFYRDIMETIQFDERRFLVNVDKYVRRTIPPENFKEISSIRGNLRKELLRPVMTWKVFIRGLKVLNVRQIDFAVKVEIKPNDNYKGPSEVTSAHSMLLDNKHDDDGKGVYQTDNALAIIFKDIMFRMGVDTQHFMRLISEYIVKANLPTNVKEVSSTRGNLKKELFKNAITWKVFVKGLSFINVHRFTLILFLHHASTKITEHRFSVNIDDLYSK